MNRLVRVHSGVENDDVRIQIVLLRNCLIVILATIAVIVACSDKNEPFEPELSGYRPVFDYVWCDTASRMGVHTTADSAGERFIDGDYILGEPFTDVNGNGVYDPGLDIFIMSADSSNQDLNHNGRYDGPDDPYSPGIPYDDLNHNGVYDPPDSQYQIGEPFFDSNDNGKYDSTYAVVVVKGEMDVDSIGAYYYWRYCDSVASFVSDSGISFSLPSHDEVWSGEEGRYRRHPQLKFRVEGREVSFEDPWQWLIPLTGPWAFTLNWDTVTVRRLVSQATDSVTAAEMTRITQHGGAGWIGTLQHEDRLRIDLVEFRTGDVVDGLTYYRMEFCRKHGLAKGTWSSYLPIWKEESFQVASYPGFEPQPMIRDTITP